MALVENTLFGNYDKVEETIKIIKAQSKKFKLCGKFSGGACSIVTKDLFKKAGVDIEWHYNITTIDPPHIVYFIRKYHPDVIIEYPRISMWNLIVKKGFPPTRVCRYCCSEFKERQSCPKDNGYLTITGVRKEESPRRKNRSMFESCQAYKGVYFYHPIINWLSVDLWDYISLERLPYCELYDRGWKRIGCIGCPLARTEQRIWELDFYPKFKDAYYRTFERMLIGRKFDKWKNASDVMDWYLYGADTQFKPLEGQVDLFYGDYYEQFTSNDLNSNLDAEYFYRNIS